MQIDIIPATSLLTCLCSHIVDLSGKKQIFRSNKVRQVGLDFAFQKMRYLGQAFLLPGKIWENRRKRGERWGLSRESSLLLLDVGEITGKSMYVFKPFFFFF